MGFWHTGYIEFHETLDLEGWGRLSPPPVYTCTHCGKSFTTTEDLRVHRFEQHPFERPCLFVRGKEVGTTPIRITKSLDAAEIFVERCDQAWINEIEVVREDISRQLAEMSNDTLTVRLENKAVSANFTLVYEIASAEDLEGVDDCFQEIAKRGCLDKRAIEEFIEASRKFPTALLYCDGICEYLYGVLTKERSPESSLEYVGYLEKFNRAENCLKDFDRPLAREICGLIAFHFNHFSESASYAHNSRVGIVADRFKCWTSGGYSAIHDLQLHNFSDDLEQALTDFETERLLKWGSMELADLSPYIPDIKVFTKENIPELDRTKLMILLAEHYASSGNSSEARRHAIELRNSVSLSEWADRIYERTNHQS